MDLRLKDSDFHGERIKGNGFHGAWIKGSNFHRERIRIVTNHDLIGIKDKGFNRELQIGSFK